MNHYIPNELINKILSFRGKHPVAVIMKKTIIEYKEHERKRFYSFVNTPWWRALLTSFSCHIDTENAFMWFSGKLEKLNKKGQYIWEKFDN